MGIRTYLAHLLKCEPHMNEKSHISIYQFMAALEQRCAKTYALKQGMMQELLTGITRLV